MAGASGLDFGFGSQESENIQNNLIFGGEHFFCRRQAKSSWRGGAERTRHRQNFEPQEEEWGRVWLEAVSTSSSVSWQPPMRKCGVGA